MDVVAGGVVLVVLPPSLPVGLFVNTNYRLRLVPGAVEVAWCRATAGSDRIASLLGVSSCRPSGGGVRRPWSMAINSGMYVPRAVGGPSSTRPLSAGSEPRSTARRFLLPISSRRRSRSSTMPAAGTVVDYRYRRQTIVE
jgi:hypothetical protein